MRYFAQPVFLALAALAATVATVPAAAQLKPATDSRSIASPYSGRTYLGLGLGRPRYDRPCSVNPLFSCEDKDRSGYAYAGSMLNNHLGVEVGYLEMGRAERAGGVKRAQGMNLSLVGKVPVVQAFGLYGKVGTTYGRIESGPAWSSGLSNSGETGFGLSYGAGLSFDFTSNLSATLGWDSHELRFSGSGRDTLRATSLGLSYRY